MIIAHIVVNCETNEGRYLVEQKIMPTFAAQKTKFNGNTYLYY